MAEEKTKVTVVDQSVGAGDTEVVIIHEVHENETKSRWEWRFPAMPLYYITLVVLAMLVGYLVGRWQFSNQGSEATSQTVASMSETQVRLAGLDLANEIRKFLLQWGIAENQRNTTVVQQMSQTASETERAQVWQSFNAASVATLQDLLFEYEAKFKPKATVLRSQLLKLLPESSAQPEVRDLDEPPASHIDVRKVMEDLGALSESLMTR